MNRNNNNNIDDIPQEAIEKMARRLSYVGAILIAVAVVGVCFSIAKIEIVSIKIVVAAIAVAVGLIGIFLMIVAGIGGKELPVENNFFLYDKKSKQSIEVSELTISLVREKMVSFMASFKHRGKLYIGDLFDDRSQIPDHFKPLFCYELLCEISDENGADAETFLSFGYECAEIFSKYLSQNGDYELAMNVKSYILDFSNGKQNVSEFKSYLSSKRSHIEERMLDYTKSNIKKFG